MEENNKQKRKFGKKLVHKYRLLLLNEDTFEEKLSFKLTPLNVFVVVGLSAILLVLLTTILIAFTGLREYIPGYSSTALRQKTIQLAYETDSLQRVVEMNNQFYNSIKKVLGGELPADHFNKDSILMEQHKIDTDQVDLSPSKADSLLREQVVREDKYNVLETATSKTNYALFPPVKGPITEPYSIKDKHYAVDIVVARNTPIKAVADGTVIFSEWTAGTGNVIIIEHGYGLISVYKHNSTRTKEQGERVKKGEVIATAGSTGSLSTGPHLHFELWSEDHPLNPTDFIDFD